MRGGRIGVDDEADVGLVDAHAEGDGRHHHRAVLGLRKRFEPLGRARPCPGRRDRPCAVDAGVAQGLGQLLGAVARAGIDDARPAAAARATSSMHAASSARGRCPCARPRAAVRAGEAVDELGGVLEAQLGADVVAGAGVGGGGDRQARHAGEQLGQPAQRAVVGAEVVAPLADAVGLVDGDQRQRQCAQPVQHRAAASGLRARRRAGRARRPRSARQIVGALVQGRGWNRAGRRRRPTASAPRPGRSSGRSAARPPGRGRAAAWRGSGSRGSCRRRSAARPGRCARPAPRSITWACSPRKSAWPQTRSSVARAASRPGEEVGGFGEHRRLVPDPFRGVIHLACATRGRSTRHRQPACDFLITKPPAGRAS